ncbi:unnamed protein product [Closterium sp. NIES-53]
MHRSMWEIPVLPWKDAAARLAAEAVRGGHASHVTSGGGGDGSDGGLLVHRGGALPSVTPSTGETNWLTAHRRFGHVALPQLQQLFKEERVKGLRIKGEPKEVGSCETCLTSKFSRFPFHSTVGQSSDPVELVHVDLVGPMKGPKEKWSGKKPLVDMLRVFGCMGLVRVPMEKRDKLQAASVWAVHLGLVRGSKGWLMWDPKSNTIFTTRDDKFMEGLMFKEWSERGRRKVTILLGIEVLREAADVEGVLQQWEAPVAERGDTEEEVQQPTPSPKLPPRCTTQGKCDAVRVEPWKEQPRRGPRELPTLRISSNAEERLERRKTRLVIKGFQQREGIDFQEVFAPLAKAPMLRLLLAAATVCGWKVEQMDVKTAFLYGVVDEEIYMKQPEGYDDGSRCVCRLNKAIYGLKQAPRCWYARLVEALEVLGFKVSGRDESLFMTEGEEEKVFLLIYVDDILLFSPSLERIKEVQGKLKKTFQCKALRPVGYYLGLHVDRDEVKGWLRLHQHKYLAAMGEKYGLEEGRSVKTPLPSGFQLHLDEDEVSQLARVVSRPLQEHLDAAERLVRYCMAASRLSSSSELTEVSHELGGDEGEAADVEGVLQQGEAPVAERGDTEEEVQQPTPSPKLPPRRTTEGKRDAVCGGAKEGAAKERPKRAAHPRDFLKYERLGGPKALLVQEEEDEEEKGAEGEMEQICCFGVNLPHEPASMEEVLAGDDGEASMASREDEFKSHMENETWTLTNLPPGGNALDCT